MNKDAGSGTDIREEARSLLQWLDSWGEGPNWSDPNGATVPVTKASLRRILEDVACAQGEQRVLEKIRNWADDVEVVRSMRKPEWTAEQLRALADRLQEHCCAQCAQEP